MELLAGVIGAVVGAVIAGITGFLQQNRSRRQQTEDRIWDNRARLVRELVRYRLDPPALIGPLNEVPLVFGHNPDALRLYRLMLDAADEGTRTRALTDLVNVLATETGLPSGVQLSDIQRGFNIQPGA